MPHVSHSQAYEQRRVTDTRRRGDSKVRWGRPRHWWRLDVSGWAREVRHTADGHPKADRTKVKRCYEMLWGQEFRWKGGVGGVSQLDRCVSEISDAVPSTEKDWSHRLNKALKASRTLNSFKHIIFFRMWCRLNYNYTTRMQLKLVTMLILSLSPIMRCRNKYIKIK